MKILALLFALYTTGLSLAPCADVCCDEEDSSQTIQVEQHEKECDDLCSPFCQFNCCHGFVVLTGIVPSFQVGIFSQKHFSVYSSPVPSGISATHWQPPKIS